MSDSTDLLRRARELVSEGTPAAVVTIVAGGPVGSRLLVTATAIEGGLADHSLNQAAIDAGRAALASETSGLVTLTEGTDAFVDVFSLPPLLVMIGAVHVAQAIVPFARALGFRIAVADARATLATRERFPDVDDLVVAWPDDAYGQLPIDRNSAIVILTHDPKFDEPAILGALKTTAAYIGAVGSRKTNADRRVRLLEGGASEPDLERVHGPMGLNIGGSSPEEMAISILAEVIAVRNGRDGGFLRAARGSIRGNG